MEKAYIVKLESGEELGPMDEKALRRLAEEGNIPEDALIRSTMLAIWDKAKNTDCLKKIYRAQMLKRAEQFANDPKAQLRARLEMRGDYDPLATALSQEGITYHECSLFTRLLAGLFDLVILGAIAFGVLFLCWSLMKAGALNSTAALATFLVVSWSIAALYYMYFLAKRGQTIGQHFWGIIVTTADHGRVYPIKGFLFFLLTALFGIISPITWMFLGCRYTLQEAVPKVQVKSITIARKTY